MKNIFPRVYLHDKFSILTYAKDLLLLLFIASIWLIFIVLGLVVVALAIPYSKKYGEVNEFGWQLELLPRWAWPWSNEYDGLQGQKNGENYSSHHRTSFWSKYKWAAIRNPANNFSRYTIGVDYNKVSKIDFMGSALNVDSDVKGFAYYRLHSNKITMPGLAYCNGKRVFRIGLKAKTFRYEDRPWCGFTAQTFKAKGKGSD